ncbi:MAG: DNA repair protein RadC [Holosporaceae bacterium]|jgi:DNA repair protein RadC|nr:DNA repair protein RadC [Holosporaceae bacterium]
MKSPNEKPHYLGHRQRLLERFTSHPEYMSDYELIEMLLFYVFRRRDTKPLAKTLLRCFKSVRGIILADLADLRKIDGCGKSSIGLITLMREIFSRTLWEKIIESKTIMSISQIIEYYRNVLGHLKKEQFRIMFLNNKNKLISEDLMQEGTINNTAIYPREIIQKALEYGAGAIIMIHNHPSGDPKPSRQDIIMTKIVQEIGQKLDIILLDHVIIGKNGTISFKELGIIL